MGGRGAGVVCGGGSGVNNVPLDILLHDDIFLLLTSTAPCNTAFDLCCWG